MARPRTGSKRTTPAGTIEASIATASVDPSIPRMGTTFPTEAAADRWLAAAQASLDHGQLPPDPAAYLQAPAAPKPHPRTLLQTWSLEESAWRWWEFHYEEQRRGGPERARDVAAYLRNHIFPYFGPHLWTINDLDCPDGIRLGERFPAVLAGDDVDPRVLASDGDDDVLLTVREILSRPDAKSKATLNRRRRDGALRPAGTDEDGNELFRLADVRAAEVLNPTATRAGGYDRDYARDVMWTVRKVVKYAIKYKQLRADPIGDDLRSREPDYAKARTKPTTKKPRPFTYPETARTAPCLHVVHQAVLWMLRVLGLRIGEAFGPHVGDLIDLGDHGVLIIDRQGGRPFLTRDRHGDVVRTDEKEELKTEASHRVIVVPQALMRLLRILIEAYHTDPTSGEVDLGPRLIPGLRKEDAAGQGAFRDALTTALRRVGLSTDDLDFRVSPHLMRKSLVTDLSTAQLDGLAARRYVGYVAGTDVHASAYIMDSPELHEMRLAAEKIDQEIARAIGDLPVATTMRPSFGRATLRARRAAYSDAVLAEAGWQVETCPDDEELITSNRAAAELGLGNTTVRRYMANDVIPSEKRRIGGKDVWVTTRAALDAYRETQEHKVTLPGLVDELEVGYHELRNHLRALFPDLPQDDATGEYLLAEEHAEGIRSEYRRIARLRERSMTVAQAAYALRHLGKDRTIRGWVGTKLELDGETDFSGKKYVTRASVEALLTDDATATPEVADTYTFTEVARVTGLSIHQLKDLVHAGLLKTCVLGRRQVVTADSLRTWVVGYRPDLLKALPTANDE